MLDATATSPNAAMTSAQPGLSVPSSSEYGTKRIASASAASDSVHPYR